MDFPQLEVTQLSDYEHVPEDIADAEIYFGWSLNSQQAAAARKLRWIHSPAAAVHQLMIPEIVSSDIVVTNARDVHGPVVAEHAIALILALAKKLPSAFHFQQKKIWAQTKIWDEFPRPRELQDSTLLLLGLGSIGREIVPRAQAFGMKVIAVREHPEKSGEGADEVFGAADLDKLLPQADFILITAPLTAATRNLFNRERLAKLKSDAYLVNVSRGPLIDESALADALRQNKIGGAALDVFTEEPLPADSPLWALDNLLITPHTAALTEKLWERHYALIGENLRRYFDGKPLRNVVDKQKGY